MVDEEEDSGSVDGFPKAAFHQAVADARARLREFYLPSQNRFRQQTEDIKPMPMSAPSERVLYQLLHFDTEKELTKLVEAELKKGEEYGNSVDSGIPGSARYDRDSD